MLMHYPGAFDATHKCVAGEGGRNVEDQDIFCFFFFWIRLYRVLIIEYAVGELLHMVLIIVYHPQWF